MGWKMKSSFNNHHNDGHTDTNDDDIDDNYADLSVNGHTEIFRWM